MKNPADHPPILRFLLIFCAGLAIATGLAAVGHDSVEPAPEVPAAAPSQP